jgi:hypothetical protein
MPKSVPASIRWPSGTTDGVAVVHCQRWLKAQMGCQRYRMWWLKFRTCRLSNSGEVADPTAVDDNRRDGLSGRVRLRAVVVEAAGLANAFLAPDEFRNCQKLLCNLSAN